MSAFDALRSVARGERPNGELLPPCRLDAFGSEFFGEEAIVQSFRTAPVEISEHAIIVESLGHLAVIDGDVALVADVFGQNISRIWRLGAGQAADSEPSVGVPFDADLMQSRGDLAMRSEDHPALSANAIPCVAEIGRSLGRGWNPEDGLAPYRCRSFLVRAFDQGSRGAALFALHTLGSAAVRTIGFSYAVAVFEVGGDKPGNPRIVRDKAGEAAIESRPWKPRVE